jgi:hypothetical protein
MSAQSIHLIRVLHTLKYTYIQQITAQENNSP